MAARPAEVICSEAELRAGFAAFVAASQALEASYAALQARAQAVDLQLQDTNQKLQQALQEREAIFAALPLGLLTNRADGSVGCCNHEGERLCAAAAAAGIDLPAASEGEHEFGDGAVRVRRVALPDGELVLLEDRSQVAALERQVHRLDRLAGLSELALGVAHELKNPLNGVMGFAELLERQPDASSCRRWAGKIVQGLRQVDDILKAMLGFARPEQRRSAPAPVLAIVAEAAVAAGLPQQRIELAGASTALAESFALVRVLANLFRNSREAAGELVSVRVQASVRGDQLELLVRDDGPGVPAAMGRSALEPFVTSKERGTGLGLALCARVLSFLGGRLELQNPGERGACFCVHVPLAAPVPATAPRPAEASL
ncbi:MAG TPA: ATP-binding protein [Planctomycetota bacterium]|nr:ATP-binding protein [Planctomycetota bacterium]